jgi:hypothetical protein
MKKISYERKEARKQIITDFISPVIFFWGFAA